jgi:hypothetical protein
MSSMKSIRWSDPGEGESEVGSRLKLVLVLEDRKVGGRSTLLGVAVFLCRLTLPRTPESSFWRLGRVTSEAEVFTHSQ